MVTTHTSSEIEQTARNPIAALNSTTPGSPLATAAMDCTDDRSSTRVRPDESTQVLVVTIENGHKLNAFQTVQALSKFGTVSDVLRTSETQIEVTMSSKSEAVDLLATKLLTYKWKNSSLSVPVTVAVHPTKNTARGVISSDVLEGMTEEEILEGMEEQGVVAVRRMNRREEGKLVGTNTVLLSFRDRELPDKVRVGWRRVAVRKYVPDPTRCFRCQRFGHVARSCKGKERCGKCSALGHSSKSCEESELKCAGCDGNHEAWSRSCPTLLAERQKLRDKSRPRQQLCSCPKLLPVLWNVHKVPTGMHSLEKEARLNAL